MSAILSIAHIEAIVGDPAAFKAGRALARPASWQNLGRSSVAVWGDCQGSGSKPYQVAVDLEDLAYKCSCPSRKIPCKHCIALLVMMVEANTPETPALERVNEWLDSRRQRAEKKASKQAEDSSPDPVAQAARAARRDDRISKGLDELALWMADRVRQGLADLSGKPASFWESQAKRLIDAQAPGAANLLREVGAHVGVGSDWPAKVLAGLGKLQLLIDGYSRIDQLEPQEQAEIRSALGLALTTEQVLATGELVSDVWQVLGYLRETDGPLTQQRLWLRGTNSSRYALLLTFAPNNQPLTLPWLPGYEVTAELVFYPGTAPLRAVLKQELGSPSRYSALQGYPDLASALQARAAIVAVNPWITRLPVVLTQARLMIHQDRWFIRDNAGLDLELAGSQTLWTTLAVLGADPMPIFGEWGPQGFVLLSWFAEQLFYQS